MFQNCKVNNPKTASLENIVKAIITGNYKSQIELLRKLVAENKEEANKFKTSKIPAFTPSGVFEKGKLNSDISHYNKIIVLDFDKIPENRFVEVFQKSKEIPFTLISFKSPSGNGLKVLVSITSELEDHELAFSQVKSHYEKALDIEVDPSGKNVARLCIMSYDPNAYINSTAEAFKVKILKNTVEEVKYHEDFGTALNWTCKKFQFVEGQRNHFIHYLACNCNKLGIDKDRALNHILSKFQMESPNEIPKAVNSAYMRYALEFGVKSISKNNSVAIAGVAESCEKDGSVYSSNSLEADDLKNLPFISDFVYENLPDILKRGCDLFPDKRQKDVFLTSSIGILSGCLSAINGSYASEVLSPNLYTFIIAPPASGKGSLVHSKRYGIKYHKELHVKSKENKAKQVLFIPGNSSASALISLLEQNEGKGIFVETEADTLGNTLKQEWGNFSDLLRKAFHHEQIGYTRKQDNEYIDIQNPKLSVVISGTPGQIRGLIKSSEDGLFSRFLFYAFRSENEWIDVSPKKLQVNLQEELLAIEDQSYEMIKHINSFENINFIMEDHQWEMFNLTQKKLMNEITKSHGDYAGSLCKRMGIMWFRLSMILTSLRNEKSINKNADLICNDIDFESAKILMETYKEHILAMFLSLPEATKTSENNNESILFENLPSGEFSRQDALTIASKLGMKTRNADHCIKSLKEKNLITKINQITFKKS